MKAPSLDDFRGEARQKPARVALADGTDPRVVEAAALAEQQRIAEPLLIGPRPKVQALWKKFSRNSRVPCIDPSELTRSDKDRLIDQLLSLTKFKSLTREEAELKLADSLILGCLYTRMGMTDGFIGGATRTTADTLKAVFSIVGLAPKTSTLFGFFFIQNRSAPDANSLVLLADCAVIPDPSPKQLANIAIGAAEAYEYFTTQKANVAFLSFSTHGSAEHPMVDKVKEALSRARVKAPDLKAEGEWQADAALDSFSAAIKGVGVSSMAGQANVLIAPDLNCGNIAYKLVQRLGGSRAVGPVLWGTALPANDLSRGCTMDDVVDMLALTTIQAKKTKKMETPAHAR